MIPKCAWTRPFAFRLRFEVILISAFSVVLEGQARLKAKHIFNLNSFVGCMEITLN